MTAPNAPEPKELVTSRAKGPAPKPKWRTRVSARAIGLWLVVGGLSVLFAIIAVAVALAQIRAFQPTTLGVAVLFLAPIGGAIAAIVLYARGLGRATIARTQAVEAARGSESGFRTVAATMADGILTIDERSRIQYMNDAAAKLFGYSQDELLGHELTEVMPERFRPRHLSAFRRYLETGEKHVAWQGIEFSGRHKGGHEIPIEVSLGEYSAGGRRLFIGVVRDVTERTRAREAQSALAAIVENSADAIIGTTLDGRITSWNRGAERMYGYTASEAIGQPISLLVPEDRRDELAQVMERLRRGEAVHHFETTRLRKDGRKIDAAITISPVRDASGRLVGAATIARDVTDQNELQRRVLESERWGSMGRIASFVAHEINTPLTNISLLTASIARRTQDPDIQTRLGKITAQGKIAASITAELLKFGKPGTLNVVDVDLTDIVRAAVEQAEVYRKDGVASRLELGDGPVPCRADPLRIQEVLVNLLKNAYEATSKGTVRVRTEEQRDFLAVIISDTGTGMPPDVQKRIFEPFFTTKKKGEGTGLGLALSKNFIVAHGGDILVASVEGKGSSFTVLLPRNLQSSPSSEGPRPEDAGRPEPTHEPVRAGLSPEFP